MIIADTSGLIAFFSESGPQHDAVVAWLNQTDPVMVVSPYVDRKHFGVMRPLDGGNFTIVP